jgi:hypothetical protein
VGETFERRFDGACSLIGRKKVERPGMAERAVGTPQPSSSLFVRTERFLSQCGGTCNAHQAVTLTNCEPATARAAMRERSAGNNEVVEFGRSEYTTFDERIRCLNRETRLDGKSKLER